MMDKELIAIHGNDDTVPRSLLCAYEWHYPSRNNVLTKWQEINQVTEYGSSAHTREDDDDGNEMDCGDAICTPEKIALAIDDALSHPSFLRWKVQKAMKNKV